MLRKHGEFLASVFVVLDLLILTAAWILAYYLRHSSFWWSTDTSNPYLHHYSLFLIPIWLTWVLLFKNIGLYKPRRIHSLFNEVLDVLKSSTISIIILITIGYFLKKDAYSRSVFTYFWILSVTFLCIERLTLREILRIFRKRGYNTRNVIIVGAGDLGIKVADKIRDNRWSGLELIGFMDDKAPTGSKVNGTKVLGKIKELRQVIRDQKIDQIFIALPVQQYSKLLFITSVLSDELVTLRIVPDIYQAITLNAGIEEFDGMPLINLTETPMYGWSVIVKRITDIIVSSTALIGLSPLFIIISLIIKLTSSGPVIFKQKRYGLDGKEIKVYKFRSMSVCEDGSNVSQAKKGDSRITKFGWLLRRTSLDELPQFLNVLQGRMSVVGPRPHAVAHNEEYRKIVKSYMLRHKVKPGITGWAQVNGWRGETDTVDKMEKRVQYDLYYIENWSIWLDIKIILMTIWKGLVNKNAY